MSNPKSINNMNWLSKLFRTNRNGHPSIQEEQAGAGQSADSSPSVPEDLFIDNETPGAATDNQVLAGSDISRFLDRDFRSQGLREGYHAHNNEWLTTAVRQIKSEFRLEADRVIDGKKAERQQMEDLRIETEGVSEISRKRLEAKISQLDRDIVDLEQQKKLSADDEGWVMTAIHQYLQGFTEGMQLYLDEKTLGITTGFFN
jgi:hypothetical protein